MHQVSKISTLPSPITNLEHRFALRTSNYQVLSDCLGKWSPDDSAIANAQLKRIFQIGDRQMQSADFGNLMREVSDSGLRLQFQTAPSMCHRVDDVVNAEFQ
jgi:hypothetical protein